MQKAVTALEKNVEWIALGLAAIWVLWIVWAFVITKPVPVDVDGQKMSPGKVDEYIANNATEQLKNAIVDKGGTPTIIVPPVALDWRVAPPPAMPVSPIFSDTIVQAKEEDIQIDPRNPNTAVRRIPAGDKVAQLPEIPTPRIVDVIADKGQVIPPVVQQNLNQQVGPDGAPAAQPLIPPTPQQVQPDALGGANALNVNAKDEWWVWVTAKFNEAVVQEAYKAAKIPPHLNRMEYLAVEVQREELLPDGKWGNPTLVGPLKHNAPPPEFDRQRVPMEYLSWALRQENQLLILEPPFFQTVGTRKTPFHLQPKAPQMTDTMVQMQYTDMKSLAVQWESMLPTDRKMIENKLTPEQKAELYRERNAIEQERKRQEAQQRQSQAESQRQQRRSSRSSSGSGGRSYAPIDPELMGEMLASGSGTPPSRWNPRGDYYRGSSGTPIPMINPVNPVDPTQMNVTRPGGIIDASGRITFGEFDVWAYDDTVEPGKTYHYRMRVVLKNPVFKINGAVADPKLASVMELPADKNAGWSQWSKAVVVERGVEMFLAGAGRGNENVRFDIYRWQDGKVNKQIFTATPGDVVGSVDSKSKVDFNTGYAVVDIRSISGRDCRVTLLDPNGAQVVRTLIADQNDPKKNALEAEASKPANPALTDVR